MTKTVLLTGFEPFNQAVTNPSWEAVRALDGWHGDGFRVVARELPCVFGEAARVLLEAVDACQPDVVIAVGQAGGRADISVERIAINVDDAPIADNASGQPRDAAIVAGGPAAYFATLPIKAIVQGVRARGIASSVSQTAGTFVCNHVFYALMHDTFGQSVQAGFIHVPFLPEQVADKPGVPGMPLAQIIDALRAAVEVTVNGGATGDDIHGATM